MTMEGRVKTLVEAFYRALILKLDSDLQVAVFGSLVVDTTEIRDDVKAIRAYLESDRQPEATEPTALDIVSARNLREAGEISDEHGSFGLQDLYVTRDCETSIIDAIRDIDQPLFITGPAGSGKTSTLWRIANRLIADGADIYFFRADFLVSDDGFESVGDIPFSVHAKSYVIVDTVDSTVGQSQSRQRLENALQEFQRKRYAVIAAIRPAEKNRFFTSEKSIPIPGSYNDREFSRVVESHVKAFYRLKDADTIAVRVEGIKAIASGNTPVVELVYHPLTLRMLFAIYAPTEIPTEVNAISLYLEFWRKRVEADWRAGRPEPEPNPRNLSKATAWMAGVMLMDGSLQVGHDQINLAISQGHIGQGDVAELTTRGILHRITTGMGRQGYEFFHQTFFEFAAAWAIVAGEANISVRELYSHLKENPFDSLRIPVIQNTLALGQFVSEEQNSTAREILKEILEKQPENRHRAARVAYMALSKNMGLELDFSAMKHAFDVEKDPRTAAWIAMCNMEVALSPGEVESAYQALLQVCANGDQYVRDRATDALIRAVLEKAVPFQVDEFLSAIRTYMNLNKICAAAKLAGEMARIDCAAAGKIARFVLLDPQVNGLGKTVLTSVRIQTRIPLMLWARSISEAELLELVSLLSRLDAEIALLIADVSLHSRYKNKAAAALQGLVHSEGLLVPELARGIGKLVRSRTINIQPLLRRAAA